MKCRDCVCMEELSGRARFMSAVRQGVGEVKQMCKGAENGEGLLEHRWEQTWQQTGMQKNCGLEKKL